LNALQNAASDWYPRRSARTEKWSNEPMNHSPILVIGSSGKTGRRIVQRLSEKGHTVRNGSRQSEPPFDWENPGTWPTALRGVEAVGEISKAAGRDIRYAAISSEQFRAALTEDAGPELANLLTDLCAEVLDGRNATLGDGVQKALGREPRDFADYCRAAAASGAWH
jgi:NAD(P)-dependent dehydrogenase (short-subunit alcohol dehydrogenase family)